MVLDDIFQGGDVAKDIMEVRRGQRTIYRGASEPLSCDSQSSRFDR